MSNRKRFLMKIPEILLVFMVVFMMGCPTEDSPEEDEELGGDPVTLVLLKNSGPWVGGPDGTSDKTIVKVNDADTGAGTFQRLNLDNNAVKNVTYAVENEGYLLKMTGDVTLEYECYISSEGALRLVIDDKTYNLPPKN